MKLSIVGCGNIGSSLVRAWIVSSQLKPDELLIIDSDPGKVSKICAELSIDVQEKPSEKVSDSEIVVLSIKPQDFKELAQKLAPFMKASQLLISVMAGISVESLSGALNGHKKIVRCMPNLPALINKGVTAFYKTPQVSVEEALRVKALFDAVGVSLEVLSEDKIDSATALSGTGPGYFYYIVEKLEQICMQHGFTNKEAENMIYHTIAGSLALWHEAGESAAELRKRVTSKNGTTHAAVSYWDSIHFEQFLANGLEKAFERAKQLSKG